MRKDKANQLTSVRVYTEPFTKFKIKCIEDNFNLNKLVNAVMDKYVEDPEFRKEIKNYKLKIEE